ncbi:hypothetical protein NDU88_005702 [Pleurodeles waltl]|uniref:Uncharacterized protein n=1 Tax=Pleurodeles waltl TaxID=8319 RepID=A0AAV7SMD5_PLEWA|nr:hypothetical protein NDU88_005702 [Pleurodeles waltl]
MQRYEGCGLDGQDGGRVKSLLRQGPLIILLISDPPGAGGSKGHRGNDRGPLSRSLRPFSGPSAKTWGRAARWGDPTETEAEWLAAGEHPARRWAAEGRGPEGLLSWDVAAGAPRLLKVHGTQQKETAWEKVLV